MLTHAYTHIQDSLWKDRQMCHKSVYITTCSDTWTHSVLVLSSLLFKINGVCLFFRLPGAKNETEAGRNVGETTAVMLLQLFITETCCVYWINEFTLKIWASRAFYKAMQGGARSFGFQPPRPSYTWNTHSEKCLNSTGHTAVCFRRIPETALCSTSLT